MITVEFSLGPVTKGSGSLESLMGSDPLTGLSSLSHISNLLTVLSLIC
jgi:hypothetical protein